MHQHQYYSAEHEFRPGGVCTQAVRTPAPHRTEAPRAARQQPQEGGGRWLSSGPEGEFRSPFEPVAQEAPPPCFEGHRTVRGPLQAAPRPDSTLLMAMSTTTSLMGAQCRMRAVMSHHGRMDGAGSHRHVAPGGLSRMARHVLQGVLTESAAPLQRPKASRGTLPVLPSLSSAPSAASGCVRASSPSPVSHAHSHHLMPAQLHRELWHLASVPRTQKHGWARIMYPHRVHTTDHTSCVTTNGQAGGRACVRACVRVCVGGWGGVGWRCGWWQRPCAYQTSCLLQRRRGVQVGGRQCPGILRQQRGRLVARQRRF